ncbi:MULTISPECIES: metallophosphoesterase [unclassified Virgibacillus]|uniref:metallophosphoesterase family protein n=1 Tax=unclassified Virgibacillus TaxID=2620237 RepID=UPI0024DE2659|nr:metallophosphoesterase [Virgibacillus sp. LDC-1]
MNQALIISDSHGMTKEVDTIKKRHSLDLMIHCGDSELDMDAPILDNFIKVGGNCDFDSRYPNDQFFTVGGLSFFVTHGHLYGVKEGLTRISYKADEMGAQVICFGHTHVAGAIKQGNQLFINPGSIRLPRRRQERTYAIIEWDEGFQHVQVSFYDMDGSLVPEMTYQTTLNGN